MMRKKLSHRTNRNIYSNYSGAYCPFWTIVYLLLWGVCGGVLLPSILTVNQGTKLTPYWLGMQRKYEMQRLVLLFGTFRQQLPNLIIAPIYGFNIRLLRPFPYGVTSARKLENIHMPLGSSSALARKVYQNRSLSKKQFSEIQFPTLRIRWKRWWLKLVAVHTARRVELPSHRRRRWTYECGGEITVSQCVHIKYGRRAYRLGSEAFPVVGLREFVQLLSAFPGLCPHSD